MPSSNAFSLVLCLKNTPCTTPLTVIEIVCNMRGKVAKNEEYGLPAAINKPHITMYPGMNGTGYQQRAQTWGR